MGKGSIANMALYALMCMLVCGCSAHNIADGKAFYVPPDYEYTEIKTSSFTVAAWIKTANKNYSEKGSGTLKIYIEGDGNAFNSFGYATSDPTPKGMFMRNIAFGDSHQNVIYMARPCQYANKPPCGKKYWSSARFSKEIINSMAEAIISAKAGKNIPITLIGYSGGAQAAGLMAVLYPVLKINRIITISGNLDHSAWTRHHRIAPLDESLDLKDYRDKFLHISSINYAGEKDRIIPPLLIQDFAGKERTITVPNAGHGNYPQYVIEEIQEMD